MAREIIEQFVDMDSADTKRRLMSIIGRLSGPYDLTLKPRRATRSNAQTRYYYGVVVRSFVEFLAEQGQTVSTDEAHLLIKSKFLKREIINEQTGEPIGETLRSITELNVSDMASFMDQAIRWLCDTFGIVVPDPAEYGVERAA